MRKSYNPQKSLFRQQSSHKFSSELQRISEILDTHQCFVDMVHKDLTIGKKASSGAYGMTSEQVLRAAILKQMNNWTYHFLEIQCVDSEMSRAFIKLDFDESYTDSTLQENISKIRGRTWQSINDEIIKSSLEAAIEKGRTVRMDATVVKANIHEPTDSSLLYDCIRVTNDILKKLRKLTKKRAYGKISTKKAKNLLLKILNATDVDKRRKFYRQLLSGSKKTLEIICRLINKNKYIFPGSISKTLKNISLLLPEVISQTERRVIKGKKVPSDEKIVSIFEPHTDIIVKGKREVVYGHKVFLTSGVSGLITDCQIVQGNLSDSEIFMDLIERQKEIFGRVPRQTAADGGFASEDNVLDAKIAGVKDVCFSKPPNIVVEEMVKSQWVFQKLRNFRAGIEGNISTLKRVFGLDRVNWKGAGGFASYVHSAIVSYNLVFLSRRLAGS
jgi:IS5 family transposase